jgi:hypothetical protein
MLVHPTLDLLASLGLHGMAKALQDLEASPRPEPCGTPNGSPCCSTAR